MPSARAARRVDSDDSSNEDANPHRVRGAPPIINALGDPRQIAADAHSLQVHNNELQAENEKLQRALLERDEQRLRGKKRGREQRIGGGTDGAHERALGGRHRTGAGEASADEDEDVDVEPTELARRVARKFIYTKGLWLVSKDTVSQRRVQDFRVNDYLIRFDDQGAIEQGQVHDLHDLIPEDFKDKRRQKWFGEIWETMISERGHISNRLRKNCFKDITGVDFIESNGERQDRFAEHVGLIDGEWDDEQALGIYATTENGTRDATTIFRHEWMFRIWAALTRAPEGLKAFINGTTATGQGLVMETRLELKKKGMTVGGIAGCAVLSRWIVSKDAALRMKGVRDWQAVYNHYHRMLERGMQERRVAILALIDDWNGRFYPHLPRVSPQESGPERRLGDSLLDEAEIAPLQDEPAHDAFAPSPGGGDDTFAHSEAEESDAPARKRQRREDEAEGGDHDSDQWAYIDEQMEDGTKKRRWYRMTDDYETIP